MEKCCMTLTDLSQAWKLAASMKIRSLILWDLKCPIKLHPAYDGLQCMQPSDAQRFGSGTLSSRPVPRRALHFLGRCHGIDLRSSCSLISGLLLCNVKYPHFRGGEMSAGGEARRKGLRRRNGRGCSNDVTHTAQCCAARLSRIC